jgi:hypothetical protein
VAGRRPSHCQVASFLCVLVGTHELAGNPSSTDGGPIRLASTAASDMSLPAPSFAPGTSDTVRKRLATRARGGSWWWSLNSYSGPTGPFLLACPSTRSRASTALAGWQAGRLADAAQQAASASPPAASTGIAAPRERLPTATSVAPALEADALPQGILSLADYTLIDIFALFHSPQLGRLRRVCRKFQQLVEDAAQVVVRRVLACGPELALGPGRGALEILEGMRYSGEIFAVTSLSPWSVSPDPPYAQWAARCLTGNWASSANELGTVEMHSPNYFRVSSAQADSCREDPDVLRYWLAQATPAGFRRPWTHIKEGDGTGLDADPQWGASPAPPMFVGDRRGHFADFAINVNHRIAEPIYIGVGRPVLGMLPNPGILAGGVPAEYRRSTGENPALGLAGEHWALLPIRQRALTGLFWGVALIPDPYRPGYFSIHILDPDSQELGHHVGDYYYAGGIGTVIGLHLHALTGQLDVHITTQQHRLRPGAPLPPPTKERYTAVHRVPRGPVFWTVSLLSPCCGTEVHIVGSALPANLILGPDPAELWYTSGGVACRDV